jgi:hypothetical protein
MGLLASAALLPSFHNPARIPLFIHTPEVIAPMRWHVLISVFVVLALGVAFAAVPLSGLGMRMMHARKSQRRDAVAVEEKSQVIERGGAEATANIIPFPAAAPGGSAVKDEAATEVRRA